jgi:hypothetical protein
VASDPPPPSGGTKFLILAIEFLVICALGPAVLHLLLKLILWSWNLIL